MSAQVENKVVYSFLKRWKVKVTQSWSTVCKAMDCSVHGILQARILEWVTFPFSMGFSQPRGRTQVSLIAGGFFTSWATREAQEYWSVRVIEKPIPSPADLPNPGIKAGSPALQVESLPAELPGKPRNGLRPRFIKRLLFIFSWIYSAFLVILKAFDGVREYNTPESLWIKMY